MPPKGSRKRPRSPPKKPSPTSSRSSSVSSHRSPPTTMATAAASIPSSDLPLLRHLSEWQELHDRAVLALKPTASIMAHCFSVTSGSEGGNPAKGARCVKVAAFDLDDTVIMPKTGKVFPKDDPDDWRWLTPQVPDYLRALHQSGFLIVLLSNQSGVYAKGVWNKVKADALKEKIIRVCRAAQVPMSCFFSTQSASVWRKPSTGLWGALQESIEETMPGATALDCQSASFYVGDAAGRTVATLAGRKKDFSCSDRALAMNLSLPFFTPEQFFLSPLSDVFLGGAQGDRRLNAQWASRVHGTENAGDIHWDTVSPEELRGIPTTYDNLNVKVVSSSGVSSFTTGAPAAFARLDTQEMIIFVGYPGCGKSTFFRRFFQPHGYVHVNRDTLKTKEKCLSLAQSCWQGGKSVVIDNTNPSAADREPYIRLAQTGNRGPAATARPLSIRVFEFVASKGMATHMNAVRSRTGIGASIPTIAYNLFHSKHESLSTPAQVKKEGITSAVLVPPVADFEGLPPIVKKSFFIL